MTLELRNAHGAVYNAKTNTVGDEVVPVVALDTSGVSSAPTDLVPVQVTVGTSATQLIADSTPLKSIVFVKADPANAGIVYVGKAGVTTGSGFPLEKGEVLPIEIDDLSKVWAIASVAAQKLAVFAGI